MLVQEMEHFSVSKARSVARTASIETETSAASVVPDACCNIVAGVPKVLHLSAASSRNVCLMRFVLNQIARSESGIIIPCTIARTT